MSNSNPILIVVLGPTGSGKGSLPKKVLNYINRQIDIKNFVEIVIDNLVEQNPSYKQFIKKNFNGMNNNELKKYYLNPTKNTLNKYSKAYYKARTEYSCGNFTNLTCDDYNDKLFEDALENNKNIIYESTGTYFVKWIFNLYGNYLKNYDIIFAWNVVNMCELLRRNKLRALESVLKFKKNNKNPAPRLPNVSYNTYKNNLKKIIKTFSIMTAPDGELSKLKDFNNRVLVFDNTTRNINVIYDSDKSVNNNFNPMNRYEINKNCGNYLAS